MNSRLATVLFFSLISASCSRRKSPTLENGPMLGRHSMREVVIWVQTKRPATVKASYQSKQDPLPLWTSPVKTSPKEAFTAHLIADKIQPGRKYTYHIFVNGLKVDLDHETSFKTRKIWAHRCAPPTFTFAAGSGTFINDAFWDRAGAPYGGGYGIFESIATKHPAFMLWLGDNIYLRQNEWNSWTGITSRYTHDRKTSQMRELLSSCFNYAILDDHDMGPDDCDGSYAFKDTSVKAFKAFWGNPDTVSGLKGTTSYFNWADVDFFLLDNRYDRDPDYFTAPDKTQLGKKQLEWLKRALKYSRATFKVIALGGQFLSTSKRYETYSHLYDKERLEIIKYIQERHIKNILFLTGDRHFTELSALRKPDAPTIYDLTVSPLTSSPYRGGGKEKNSLRVAGTVVVVRNFALVKFSGPKRRRMMTLTICDENGAELWTKSFQRQ